MEAEKSATLESTLLRKVLRLLASLKETSIGVIIHDQIERILQDCEAEHLQVEHAYTALLYFLLEAYAKDPSAEHVLKVTARLIEQRPSSPLTVSAVTSLRKKLLSGNETKIPTENRQAAELARSVAELMKDMDIGENPQDNSDNSQADHSKAPRNLKPGSAEALAQAVAALQEGMSSEMSQAQSLEQLLEAEETNIPLVERRVNSAYRLHLDRKREEIEQLQGVLAQKVGEAINQNKEFGILLEIERNALQQADSAEEIESLRNILIGGIDELMQGQRNLSAKLVGSSDYLKLVKSDSERLHDELNKVRLLSLTDEFTNLPNRRAFMRRLEDEIGRAQRYKTPLALALIDLDEFKAINDTHGHAAGDEVLRSYARDVLSIFRHHDMVARYGGEEFSVLLPNTDENGGLAALKKVQQRVSKVTCEFEGKHLPLPTFSAGLTLYVPGEQPSELIKRADTALYRAKRLGRNRFEVEPIESLMPQDTGLHNGS